VHAFQVKDFINKKKNESGKLKMLRISKDLAFDKVKQLDKGKEKHGS